MKKNIYLFGIMLLGGAMLSSCNDMLDKEPLDSFTNSPTFWNNPSSVEGYAATFYNLFVGYGNPGNGDFYFESLTDDQAGASFKNWKYTNAPADNSNWTATYTEIRRANAMIEALNTMATEMDEDTKNHWLGVARLMRGWQHWDLVRKFGDCVWVDHVPNVDDPILYAARDDRDAVMDHVFEDLQFACNNINEEGTGVKTTWSRNMARALAADVCLWEGTFRKYRTAEENGKGPDEAGAQKFLQYCVELCEPLMAAYQLSDDYHAIYNSTSLASNSEIIFCKEYLQDIFEHSTIDYTCTSTQQDGMTKDAFDSYLFLDGQLKANTSYDTSNDVPVYKLSANDNSQHLNIKHMLEMRDRRLGITVDTILCYTGTGGGWPRVAGGMAMTSSTGYTISKYDNVTIDPAYRQNTFSNYTWCPLYWVSVVYLNYAEAKAELGTITQTDLDNTINKLKTRAGLPSITLGVNLNDPKKPGNVSSLIWEIRRERRCELMFDNDFRYWDLIRWHMLDKLDTTKPENVDITLGANLVNDNGMYDGTLVPTEGGEYIDAYTIGGTNYDRVYNVKHYLYPIPTNEITLNGNLGQNTGWPLTSSEE